MYGKCECCKAGPTSADLPPYRSSAMGLANRVKIDGILMLNVLSVFMPVRREDAPDLIVAFRNVDMKPASSNTCLALVRAELCMYCCIGSLCKASNILKYEILLKWPAH